MKPPGGEPSGSRLKAMAYLTDEGFGYERWRAEQFSGGRGERHAIITLFDSESERDAALSAPVSPARQEAGDLRERIAEAIGGCMVHLAVMSGGKMPDDWCARVADVVIAVLPPSVSGGQPEPSEWPADHWWRQAVIDVARESGHDGLDWLERVLAQMTRLHAELPRASAPPETPA